MAVEFIAWLYFFPGAHPLFLPTFSPLPFRPKGWSGFPVGWCDPDFYNICVWFLRISFWTYQVEMPSDVTLLIMIDHEKNRLNFPSKIDKFSCTKISTHAFTHPHTDIWYPNIYRKCNILLITASFNWMTRNMEPFVIQAVLASWSTLLPRRLYLGPPSPGNNFLDDRRDMINTNHLLARNAL